jgi:hypothetical protein
VAVVFLQVLVPNMYCIYKQGSLTILSVLSMVTNSIARHFLVKTDILDSLGVVEVPARCMLEEAVQFMFPAVNQIMTKLQATGGVVV